MSDRVVDESNPDNYLSTKDVHSLWAEEDLLKEIPIDPWDIQGCVQKCNKLGDVVRILIQIFFKLFLHVSKSKYFFQFEFKLF